MPKYPMQLKTEQPLFEYLIKINGNFDYYLFENFDEALKKLQTLSVDNDIVLMYEPFFDTQTREWRVTNTFTAYSGKIVYDKHARIGVHIKFHVNAGEWLNPNQEWIDIITKVREE